MKSKLIATLLLVASVFVACDDNTDTLGDSLTNRTDQFNILTDTFDVATQSFIADSVLSRGLYSYLGHVKDVETGTYVTSNYTTQFAILENLTDGDVNVFPKRDSIMSWHNGDVVADSCKLRIYFNASTGDSLTPMKLTVTELAQPIEEDASYYSNYEPTQRTTAGGVNKSKTYTALDLSLSDSLRNTIVNKTNLQFVTVNLNDTYVDTTGVSYENYGTYLMRKYYQHPEYFQNSYSFIHNVCPGFYVKSTGGLGVMSEVSFTDMQVYFKYVSNDTTYIGLLTLSGTEEVMQTTKIENDKQSLQNLLTSTGDSCTYLKTPAGIFTEVTLPVDDIMDGHANDSISQAKIVFTRLNSKDSDSDISAPQNLLLLPKDSLYSFFENKDLPDSENSFLTSLSSSYNTYTFSNISTLITQMYKAKQEGRASADWNKVVLVPVTVTTTTTSSSSYYSTSTSTITNVANNMTLTSTRLVGGSNNQRQPVTISIIYNRYKN